ncbi:MAG: alpha/beta hydrolase, partial [Tenericutes bacterium]|nr:alpha/beta hydrolase [Mycoplasmatota bacterium]
IADEAKKYIGSPDYRQASPMMRKILVNVINEDLSVAAKKINVPTLLIWGTEDQASPIEEAIELEKIIQDSALIKIDGGTHYVYLEALNYVTTILKEFL